MSNQRNQTIRVIFTGLSIISLVSVLTVFERELAIASGSHQVCNNCGTKLAQSNSSRPKTARDYLVDGLKDLQRGNAQQARANFDRALELKPDYAEILFEEGVSAFEAKDDFKAIDAFSNSIALKPNNPDALLARGKVYLSSGLRNYSEVAIADFTEVIRLKPNYAETYFLRAKAALLTTQIFSGELVDLAPVAIDYDSAIADLTRFFQLQPNTPQNKPELASAYAIRANANLEKGFYDQAIADANQILELDPRESIYAVRGRAYYGKGEYTKAIADYTNVLQIKQDDSWILSRRAEAYLALKNYDAAIADYSQVIGNMRYRNPQIYYDRGSAYSLKGDKQKAIGDFETVIELTKPSLELPDFIPKKELLEKAREQLQKLRSGVM